MTKWVRGLIWLALLAAATAAAGERYNYRLDVEGMVCAYCAYNAARHLAELPGVEAGSIHVDLESGLVQIGGSDPLERAAVAGALEAAGFSLTGMESTGGQAPGAAARAERIVLTLELDAGAFEDAGGRGVLEALGEAAASHGGRLQVFAPAAFEESLLKPLLMGRKRAVPVQFRARESGEVRIRWLAAPDHANGNGPQQ